MVPLKLTLEFYLDAVSADDLDELGDLVREAIDEKIGETEYMIQDVGLQFEIQ